MEESTYRLGTRSGRGSVSNAVTGPYKNRDPCFTEKCRGVSGFLLIFCEVGSLTWVCCRCRSKGKRVHQKALCTPHAQAQAVQWHPTTSHSQVQPDPSESQYLHPGCRIFPHRRLYPINELTSKTQPASLSFCNAQNKKYKDTDTEPLEHGVSSGG